MKCKVSESLVSFFKRETVLCIAVLLALLSMLINPPSPAYLSYIDWDTLAMLFSLMAVMKGFQKAGLFLWLGNRLLRRTDTSRKMLFALVFLPFFFSMCITNDVSLITFVPFALIVLRMAGQERLVVPLVVLQTVAANLGSMLTPMGNPQNLYLYTKSGMSFGALVGLMFPYALLAAVCLAVLIVLCGSVPVHCDSVESHLAGPRTLTVYAAGFALCLLGIFDVLPPVIILAITAVFLIFADRGVLASVDYSLLGTFVAFFVFIGNLGGVEWFRSFLASILEGHVVLVSVLASQVISNVPAALLLSGFTTDWQGLLIGCNLGGLGTLIASMASLISYKMVVREHPEQRHTYLVWFTLCNFGMLALLLIVGQLF
ncbi:MAG: SLC13 family permease [Gemmiger sp.]|uniref:SLC13 family permease n=1 Tax=Gemmiger sp. TaxID=2049027 RepID=UPI002E776C6D|nr:SLC13 family permease [Gemmiger sp.]MEE0800627.1 SLC13 family permease [Gemmiger sp.]